MDAGVGKAEQHQQQQQQKVNNIFSKGFEVEVGSEEEGLRDSWYLATVVDSPSLSPSSKINTTTTNCDYDYEKEKKNKIQVQYHSLFADELGSTPLIERVKLSLVRPSPPPLHTTPTTHLSPSFELYDVVDAYYRDGWWTGVITQLVGASRFVVTFRDPPDVVEFEMSDLRLHRQWTDGKWAPPEKQRTTGLIFSTGKKVEVSFEKENCHDVWFPATVIEDLGNDSFLVEYKSPRIGNLEEEEEPARLYKEIVNSLHIRPSPPNLKDKNFGLLDKVDAFYDFGWLSGVITKEVADSKYIVLFKHTNKERELNQSELRPHMEWRDGKWFSASRRQICSPEDGVRRITPLPDLFSTWHKDGSGHHHNNQNQGTHSKKPRSRPSKKLKAGNAGAETLSNEACQLNTLVKTTGINNNSSEQMAVDLSTAKPDILSPGEEVESNQFGGGSFIKQKKRRGRPPKLVAVKKLNRDVGGDKKSVKDEVGSPATGDEEKLLGCGSALMQINNSRDMMKTPLVAKDSQNACTVKAAAEGDKKDGSTKQVQKKIASGSPSSTGNMSDDLPLSTWLEGTRSQTTIIDHSNISLGKKKNVEESREGGAMEQKLSPAVSYMEAAALPSETERLPFVKNTALWRAIESMQVFKRMPQKPHFRDLESCNEIYREGLAVACMVNFSSLVENTDRLQLDDPRSKIEGHLKTLVELEGHGFDVKMIRDCLNELLVLKDREEELQKIYKQVESEITEHNNEISKIVEKNDEVMKQLRELQEMHALLVAKKLKEDSEIASLESKVQGINDAISNVRREFVQGLASALL